MNEDDKRTLIKEVKILKSLDHPSIIKIYDFCEDRKRYYLVIDYCKGGDLFDMLIQKGQLSEKDTTVLIKQLLSLATYCHHNKIAHRDLKPENVHLASDDSVDMITVGTFESACQFDLETLMSEKIGTPYYIAPEVLCKSYGPKCDVWSIGVITYICLFAKAPFDGSSDEDIMNNVKKGYLNLNQNSKQKYVVSDHAIEFLELLLNTDYNQRVSAEKALEHPWLELAIQKIDQDVACKALNNLKNFE